MKKITFGLFFLFALFIAGFSAGKSRKVQSYVSESEVLDHHFTPTRYPLENHPFAIVVVGYNNGAFAEKNLRSIFSQHYDNYRLIYIDDGSTDGSFELVRDLIYDSRELGRVTLVRNEERKGELASLFYAVHNCPDLEIIVWVGGEDWLAHEWVLSRLNEYYADPDLWLTYGQYREFPHYRLGQCRPFQVSDLNEKGFRGHPFVSSHLKTFYASLFKKVEESDFAYQGTFLSAAADLAVMIPLLELAQGHFQFIPEIQYIANTQLRTEGELFSKCERYIRSLTSYAPVSHLTFQSGTADE